MAIAPQVYGFFNNIITLNGVVITGYADGDDVVKLTPNAPISEAVVGALGEVVFNDNADKSYKCELTLQQTAPINTYLRGLAAQQRIPGARAVALTLSITDLARRDRFTGTSGRIVEVPEFVRGQKAGKYTWKLHFGIGIAQEAAVAPMV